MKVFHALIVVLCIQFSDVAVNGFSFVPFQRLEERTVSLKLKLASQASSDNDQESESDRTSSSSSFSRSRRNVLFSLPLSAAAAAFGNPQPAQAQLVQFPCQGGLTNTYHFMRAGESLLEEQNMWGTNPLFLTNREAALSLKGIDQVRQACQVMEEADLDLSVVKFPIAANAMDTSDIVSAELKVGRNRLVPEYTYLDQRGIGKWDMLPLDSTEDAVWAMDAREAGKEGWGGIPPPHDDGTANESLGNQVTRLRQLISLLETQLSGDSVLLIFPDGTGPAVMSCLIAGIPLNRVHEISFEPGELRMDINYNSVRELLPTTPTAAYLEKIERGNAHLKVLRANPEALVNEKDRLYEQEVIAEQKKDAESKKALLALRQAEKTERESRNEIAAANGQKIDGFFPAAFSMGAIGIAATLASWRSSGDDDEKEKGQKLNFEKASPGNQGSAVGPTRTTYRELQDMEDKIKAGPIHIPEFSQPSTAGSSQNPHAELQAMENLIESAPISIPNFSPSGGLPTEQDKTLMAEKAMKKYLDQDDGSGAFIALMGGLMEEEDE